MQIQSYKAYDVIVAGGGPAGCSAAIAAARQGAKTLLLESTYTLGGMGTVGLVTCFAPFGDGIRQITRGIAGEILKESNRAAYNVPEDAIGWVQTAPEALKRIYDRMVTESGIDIRFGCRICGADVENGTVTALYGASKDGITAYRAKQYIDCTGDGDLAAFAGADFDCAEVRQPASVCFILTNVNFDGYDDGKMNGAHPQSPIHRILALGDKYPLICDTHLCTDVLYRGTISFNAGHLPYVDATDPGACDNAMIIGREMAAQYRDALAEVDPEHFGNAYLIATSPVPGIRESRRIVGEYTLTIDDYLARREFDDNIARNCYYLDLHMSVGEHAGHEAIGEGYKPGESHGIPYRCLIPRDFGNLLVAGRSVSCDRLILSSLRVMPNCMTMGEAAGTAAALAIEQNCMTNRIDISELRKRLRGNGAVLDMADML